MLAQRFKKLKMGEPKMSRPLEFNPEILHHEVANTLTKVKSAYKNLPKGDPNFYAAEKYLEVSIEKLSKLSDFLFEHYKTNKKKDGSHE
jgi:hypothetical protein